MLMNLKQRKNKNFNFCFSSFSKIFEFLEDRQLTSSPAAKSEEKRMFSQAIKFIEQYRIFRSFKSLSFPFFVKSLVRLYEISDTPDPERTASVLDILLRSLFIHYQ